MNQEIITWLNEQHPWLQEAARRILSKRTLDANDIGDLVIIIKAPVSQGVALEKGYSRIEKNDASKDIIRLLSIGEIQGIENLAPRNPLVFGSGNLCVIYGCTGSGKSGYVRILKKACGKPGASELKPNVYKTKSPQQLCTITYSINGKVVPIPWAANDDPIPELKSLDIFDTWNARAYIDGEFESSYVPAELVFFTNLVDICKSVGNVLQNEQAALVKKLPEIPSKFIQTKLGDTYTKLSLPTEKSKIDALTSWTKEDAKILHDLNERLKTDDPNIEAKKRHQVKEQIDKLVSTIEVGLLMVAKDACRKIIELRRIAIEKRNIASEGAKVLANAKKFTGIESEIWRVLWFAARDYSTAIAYTGRTYPNIEKGARCVLCHQQLDAEARDRLNAFNSYVSGKLQSEAEAAETELKNALIALPKIPVDEDLKTICQAAELSEEISRKIITVWKAVQEVVTTLQTAATISESGEINASLFGVIADLTKCSEVNEAKARQCENDALSFDRVKATDEVLELQAKEWTAQQVTAINVELGRLQQIYQYDKWKRLTNTSGISIKAGKLSETLITEAYITRFNQELQKLGAKNISVELVKTRISYGHNKHQVRLKGLVQKNTKADEVLSEGESRIVSLAAFLADVTGKSSITPFIFDDPISSLDQIYEEKTVDRLIALSQDRQVLIFTHRLSFLGISNDRAAPKTTNIKCESWGTGDPGETPIFAKNPSGALKDLQNQRLPQAKIALQYEGSTNYYPLAKSLCSDIRIIMERIVETDFLAGIIQRHRREVQTKGKVHNLCKIKKEDCDLVDEIMSKYSRYEHSQSLEAPIALPSPNELKEDVDKILSWHNEFKRRT